jgi:hypothetical protein
VTINSAVSSYALTVIGAPYLFGGFSKSNGWDCSGCVNNILGIGLDPTYLLSALDKHYGTTVTPIDGFGPAGERLTCRHIIAAV